MVAQGAQTEVRRKLGGNVMKLPQIPYTRKKARQQITAFYGLNRSENIKDGELTDSVGMSSSAYPCLTQRAGRAEISGYSAPYDLFEWDGKLVVADGGVLYYDGEAICNISEGKTNFAPIYDEKLSIKEKLNIIAKEIYRADGVSYTTGAEKAIKEIEAIGFDKLPVCVAKTQYSLSDDPTKLGCPKNFTITVRDVKLSAGAGFVVALTGDIMTMPGLPKVPAANKIDVSADGEISGLF